MPLHAEWKLAVFGGKPGIFPDRGQSGWDAETSLRARWNPGGPIER
jgi:hypothetical protein